MVMTAETKTTFVHATYGQQPGKLFHILKLLLKVSLKPKAVVCENQFFYWCFSMTNAQVSIEVG